MTRTKADTERAGSRPALPAALIVPIAALLALPACDTPLDGWFSDSSSPTLPSGDVRTRTTDDNTWTHRGGEAPYAVTLSTAWTERPPARLNRHADLFASRRGQFYLMVIPQPLPAFEGMAAPGAKALRAAGLRRMRNQIDKFRLEDEGPVTVDGVSGVSAIAEGLVGSTLVQYVITFVTHDGWGYQIVGWGPAKSEAEVVRAMDGALRGWQFIEASTDSTTGDVAPGRPTGTDAGTSTAQKAAPPDAAAPSD